VRWAWAIENLLNKFKTLIKEAASEREKGEMLGSQAGFLRKNFFKSAFTLLELLVVLLLMSLSLALVGPKLGRFLPGSPQNFAYKTRGLLEEARLRALSEGRSIIFVIDPSRRKLFLADEGLKPFAAGLFIPENIEIRGEDLVRLPSGRGVVFFPDGLSSGGVLEIIDQREGKTYLLHLASYQSYIGD